ncbi:hypothetical protein OAK44_01595, partial [bacterium]|nr:hypothetical protein [bacterium]
LFQFLTKFKTFKRPFTQKFPVDFSIFEQLKLFIEIHNPLFNIVFVKKLGHSTITIKPRNLPLWTAILETAGYGRLSASNATGNCNGDHQNKKGVTPAEVTPVKLSQLPS